MEMAGQVTAGFERYAIEEAARPFDRFVDDLSTWYLRRSRDRIKGDDTADAQAALATTAYVLRETAKLLAPFAPFFAEWLWQEMKHAGDSESVHLTAWSEPSELTAAQASVIADMQAVRGVVSLALEQRAKAGIPVRQPLARMTLTIAQAQLPTEHARIITDEVNVKELVFIAHEGAATTIELDTTITPELRAEGQVREVVRAIQQARKDAGLTAGQEASATVSSNDAALLAAAEAGKASIMAATSLSALSSVPGEAPLTVTIG
jgi:isoleucyl-tRNA synthetase